MDTSISIKMMERLFSLLTEEIIKSYDTYFISLNSVLNTMFYDSIVAEISDVDIREEYINNIQNVIKNNIMKLYSKDKMYYFYYNSKPSINSTLYKDWDSYLNKYKFGSMFSIFEAFTKSISSFSKDFKNIRVIDTKNIEPCVIPYLYSLKHTTKRTIIISRDMMDWLSVARGIHMTDGNNIITTTEKHASKKLKCVPSSLIHKYLFLIHLDKHSYVSPLGKMKGGISKSLSFLVKIHQHDFRDDVFLDPSFKMFDMEEYIKTFKINFTF